MPYLSAYDALAQHLTLDGHAPFGMSKHHFDVKSGASLTYDASAMNEAGRLFARSALDMWTMATGLVFTAKKGNADIVFDHGVSAHDAFSKANMNAQGYIQSAQVTIADEWIQNDWYTDQTGAVTIDFSSYSMMTFVHEIGHALGLAHAGNYNLSADFEEDALFDIDSWQSTIMSYFSQTDNPMTQASYAVPITPMIADMIAVQSIYGPPAQIWAEDTVFGFGGTTQTFLDDFSQFKGPVALTIFDSGGRDKLDLSYDIHDQRIDLTPEGISDINGLVGNLIIARDTLIEDVLAGSGNDHITGNGLDNILNGGAGHDQIFGAAGHDVIHGSIGNDTLDGQEGADQITVLAGANTLMGGQDNDILIGGVQADVLDGGSGDDIIIGDAGIGVFGGSDRMFAGTGNDTLMGGNGADTFVFYPDQDTNTIARVHIPDITVDPYGTNTVTRLSQDFQSGFDKIELIGFADLTPDTLWTKFRDTDSGAIFADQGTSIVFTGMTIDQMTADDFIFV